MRLAWASDIHLNFAGAPERERLYGSVRESADALLLTGDITESPSLERDLLEIERRIDRTIYFVLGNHDFYRGSITASRARVAALVRASNCLVYLSQARVLGLTQATALVGHDGWADARLGDFSNSDVILNDYVLIEELRHWKEPGQLDKPAVARVMRALADESARHLASVLAEAAALYAHVIVATHVPPFPEAAWYEGVPADDNGLPHFSCKTVGDVLLGFAESHPDCRLLVLCGHTHSGRRVRLRENLVVEAGAARYGEPAIQEVLKLI